MNNLGLIAKPVSAAGGCIRARSKRTVKDRLKKAIRQFRRLCHPPQRTDSCSFATIPNAWVCAMESRIFHSAAELRTIDKLAFFGSGLSRLGLQVFRKCDNVFTYGKLDVGLDKFMVFFKKRNVDEFIVFDFDSNMVKHLCQPVFGL